MNPALLKTRIDIQRAVESRGAHGSVVNTWATLGTRRGFVRPMQGRERYFAQQVNADMTSAVLFRHDGLTRQITPKMRLVVGNRVLHVASVIDVDDRHREIEVLCTEAA